MAALCLDVAVDTPDTNFLWTVERVSVRIYNYDVYACLKMMFTIKLAALK